MLSGISRFLMSHLLHNKTTWACLALAISLLYFNQDSVMFVLRRGIWFVKGMQEYTKNGYLSAAKNFNAEDLNVDCTGKSYLITGSNSGIGKSVALEIARRGGTIHMLCRNSSTAEAASEEIRTATNNQNVHIHILDMSRPHDVVNFCHSFPGPLDVLVNNAGCMVNTKELDEDGLEKNFATNVLGTYLLTMGLLRMIEQSSDARVITVSSGGMLTQKLDPKDLQNAKMEPFVGASVYSQNKRAQIIMSEQMALGNTAVHFSTMHPGWADTPAVRTSMPEFYEKMKDRLRTAEQGADTIVWLAVSPAARKHPSGLFFQDRAPVATHLPLSCTTSSDADIATLMSQLNTFREKYNKTTCDD